MEIEKEKRLPFGFTTWYQVARHMESHDAMELRLRDPAHQYARTATIFPPGIQISPTEASGTETFECDAGTLKIRCFDEMADILPEPDDIRTMMSQRLWTISSGPALGGDPRSDPLYNFLTNLLNLLQPPRT